MSYTWESELPALADKSDQEAADAIRAMTTIVRTPVPLTEIAELGRTQGWWWTAKASTNAAAVAFFEYYADSRFSTINLDLPLVQANFDAIVAAGLITSDQAAAIGAIANVTVPKYPAPPHAGDVAAARRAQ